MKILSVHVQSFGKLQNFDFNFNGGLNVLSESNGFGKTTLCNFIRAMLYGFTYTRSKRDGASISDAGIWTTWNSSEKIGGSMVVEHCGAAYRIERYFGGTAKTETLSVINETSGRAESIDNPGEYFLGLTAESFDRSAYLPQESVEIASNENFDTRLAGLVQNAEDFDKVEHDLTDYFNELTSSRRANSELNTCQKQKIQLQREIYQCEMAAKRQKAIDDELKELENSRQILQQSIEYCGQQIAESQKRLGQMQQSPEQRYAQEKLAELQNKVSRLGVDFESDKAKCDELAEKIRNTPELAQKQRKVSKPLLIVGIILLLAGIGVSFVQWIAGVCGAVCGVGLCALAFFVKPKLTTLPSGERDALISDYYKLACKHVFCNGDYTEVQKALWEKYNEYECDKREIVALSRIANSKRDDTQENAVLENLNKQLADNQAQLMHLAAKQGRLQEERENLKVDSIELWEKLQETENIIGNIRHKAMVVDKTLQLLRQAKENLSVSYLPTLKDSCTQLLQQVTEQDFELVLDREFNLKLRANGITKSLDFYSRGIREITLLCFRVAISRLLFGGNVPLLIVDDAFVNFDEQNFLRATKLLKNLSKNTQIIYLTCHARRGSLQ